MTATYPDTPIRAVDVVVVGAGVIGLSAAWTLQQRGMRVAVVDPEPGSGASRAAAGMIAPASEMRHQQQALHRLMSASARVYPDFVERIEAASGVEVGYRRTETLVCAVDAADRAELAALRDDQLAQGLEVEQLTTREARALEPALTPRLAGVFRASGDHQVDPRRLVAGLLGALGSGPAPAVVVRQRVTRLLVEPEEAVGGVQLADGTTIRAEQTVVATGLSLDLITDLSVPVPPLRPVHGDILRARLPAGAPPLIDRTIRGLASGFPIYLVPRADGEVVIGATSREDAMTGPNVGGVHRLLHDAHLLVPGVADLELVEVMARARPATADDLPLVGRVAATTPVPGLLLATGGFRHGVLLAPLLAATVADLINGAPVDAAVAAAVDPRRFNPDRVGPEGVGAEATPNRTPVETSGDHGRSPTWSS